MIGFMSTGMRHILREDKHRHASHMCTHQCTPPVCAVIFSALPRCQAEALDLPLPVILHGRGVQPNVLAGQPGKQTHIYTHSHRRRYPWEASHGPPGLRCDHVYQHRESLDAFPKPATSQNFNEITTCHKTHIRQLSTAQFMNREARTTPPASAPQWCRCHQIKRQGWLNSKITGEENQHQGADRWLPIHLPLTLIRLYLIHITQTQKRSLSSFSFKVTNYSQQETSDKIIRPKSV